jgi:hypothetical protein
MRGHKIFFTRQVNYRANDTVYTPETLPLPLNKITNGSFFLCLCGLRIIPTLPRFSRHLSSRLRFARCEKQQEVPPIRPSARVCVCVCVCGMHLHR